MRRLRVHSTRRALRARRATKNRGQPLRRRDPLRGLSAAVFVTSQAYKKTNTWLLRRNALWLAPKRFAQRAPRCCARMPRVFNDAYAIGDDMRDAARMLARIFIRRGVLKRIRIKDDQIRHHARTHNAALEKSQTLCRRRGHVPNAFFPRQQSQIAHVMRQKPRVRAPTARMRHLADHNAVAADEMNRALQN